MFNTLKDAVILKKNKSTQMMYKNKFRDSVGFKFCGLNEHPQKALRALSRPALRAGPPHPSSPAFVLETQSGASFIFMRRNRFN